MDTNAVDKIVQYLVKVKTIDAAVESIMGKTVMVALILLCIFFFINLAYNYISSSIKVLGDRSSDKFFDLDELVRVIVLAACIVLYIPLAKATTELTDFINSLTAPGTKQSELMEKYSKNYLSSGAVFSVDVTEKALMDVISDKNADDKLKAYAKAELSKKQSERNRSTYELEQGKDISKQEEGGWSWNYLNPKYWGAMLMNSFALFLVSIIRIIISAVTVNIIKIMYCVGPLAIAFSVLPVFKDNIKIWFGTLLNASFVFTTMNILDSIIYASMSFLWKDASSFNEMSSYGIQIYNITIVILYTMSFWLTSKYVGKGDAGRVLTKGVMIAAAAVGGVAMMGGGAAASASSNVSRVADSAGKVMAEE